MIQLAGKECLVQLVKNKMIKETIKNLIEKSLENLKIGKINFSIEHPEDFENGDYSTNVAMSCAKKVGINPKELAEKIVAEINKSAAVT